MSPGTPISFDSNSLQSFDGNHGIITQTIEHAGKSAKRAEMYALSHANVSIIPFIEYPNKPIEVTGVIVGTSIADCDAQIDLFNSYLLTQSGNLDIGYNSGTRRYVATATNIDVQRPGGLNYANFTINFTCTQPFGQDTASTTIINATGRTLASYNDAYTFTGTTPYQFPIVTLTYSTIGDTTAQSISLGCAATGQQITVTRVWSANDVLVVDCTQNTVTVNGTVVDFSGAFPWFPPGAQTITYSDTFSSRTFADNIVYTKLYL